MYSALNQFALLEVFTEVSQFGKQTPLSFVPNEKVLFLEEFLWHFSKSYIFRGSFCAFEEQNKVPFWAGFVPKLMSARRGGERGKKSEILSCHLGVVLSWDSLLVC